MYVLIECVYRRTSRSKQKFQPLTDWIKGVEETTGNVSPPVNFIINASRRMKPCNVESSIFKFRFMYVSLFCIPFVIL